jgi:hypothetical protein
MGEMSDTTLRAAFVGAGGLCGMTDGNNLLKVRKDFVYPT